MKDFNMNKIFLTGVSLSLTQMLDSAANLQAIQKDVLDDIKAVDQQSQTEKTTGFIFPTDNW